MVKVSFEPEEIVLDLENLSENQIQEISEKSFDFRFSGFSIQERITSLGSKEGGPKQVVLMLEDEAGIEISRTTTGKDGMFTFDNLING